jgi:hypothetical protein
VIILKLNYTEILLPNADGLPAILKALTKGRLCDDRSWDRENPFIEVKGCVPIEVKVVGGDTCLRGECPKEKPAKTAHLRLTR